MMMIFQYAVSQILPLFRHSINSDYQQRREEGRKKKERRPSYIYFSTATHTHSSLRKPVLAKPSPKGPYFSHRSRLASIFALSLRSLSTKSRSRWTFNCARLRRCHFSEEPINFEAKLTARTDPPKVDAVDTRVSAVWAREVSAVWAREEDILCVPVTVYDVSPSL